MMAQEYSCVNCGHRYEAVPIDDIHIVADVAKCHTCYYNNWGIFESIFECENCNYRNILYWHKNEKHHLIDIKMAHINQKNATKVMDKIVGKL